ncbi:anthranilate phosphoribosyltransferase [Haloechinothrix alba]|uniref:Anthranilate phosphoribosyltransferase n=1 Tax=Haloechinothrix alba TaxID=664784 RepID=A0A238WKG9_9PSEU|nr:anthranilate phosphoribosyltransferase [Haloechinothrix alba]SNR46159.1 anthranilate phosphoribosyltransferase [Haloechinothrix alba]
MSQYTWPTVLDQLIRGTDIDEEGAAWAMAEIMSGDATPAQIAGFAVALRAKGETPHEIAGLAGEMLAHAHRVDVTVPAVDVVGTGGDRAGSVNISTMSALVVAAAGAAVVKHGNRAASSQAGTADVLEELGVVINLSPGGVQHCVAEVGIGFCFAPVFHPALRHAAAPRKELGVPTTFNLLGPLTNPARPGASLIGCAYKDKVRLLAEVFAQRGTSALVVRGDDGLDELTTTTTSTAWVVRDGGIRRESIDPRALGFTIADPADLRGGDAAFNARVVRDLLAGEPGPVREAVVLNAAGALAAHTGFSDSLESDLASAAAQAAAAIDSGKAANLLTDWAALSHTLQ